MARIIFPLTGCRLSYIRPISHLRSRNNTGQTPASEAQALLLPRFACGISSPSVSRAHVRVPPRVFPPPAVLRSFISFFGIKKEAKHPFVIESHFHVMKRLRLPFVALQHHGDTERLIGMLDRNAAEITLRDFLYVL